MEVSKREFNLLVLMKQGLELVLEEPPPEQLRQLTLEMLRGGFPTSHGLSSEQVRNS